jgi:transcriptional antiterminator RfaH
MVAHTQHAKEFVAEQNLLRQGFEVYCPRIKKTRRHARKVDQVLVPLFPRYIFVRSARGSSTWRSVNGTHGVSYLVRTEHKPAEIDDAVIDALKKQENGTGVVPVSSLRLFSQGQTIQITAGSFNGHSAVFEKFSDVDRIEILLTFLGRKMSVSIPVQDVMAL